MEVYFLFACIILVFLFVFERWLMHVCPRCGYKTPSLKKSGFTVCKNCQFYYPPE